jgi:hypothetical protein
MEKVFKKYKDFYISNYGDVIGKRGNVLKNIKKKDGYLAVNIYIDGVRKQMKIHRLVALSHILNPENKPQVNHVNGIKTDNRVENLEWCSPSENSIHAYKNGLINSGETHSMSKLNRSEVEKLKKENLKGIYFQRELAELFGISQTQVGKIINNKSWKYK